MIQTHRSAFHLREKEEGRESERGRGRERARERDRDSDIEGQPPSRVADSMVFRLQGQVVRERERERVL